MVNRPHKGLVTDSAKVDQPKETYSFLLNGTLETTEGKNLFVSNEKGNEECYDLPEGYLPIGKVYGTDNELYIFSTNGVNSEIGVSKNCRYETLVNNQCLNFSIEHQIDAIHRVRLGCEDVLYFTDNYNPVRYFNRARPELHKTDGEWDCNKFKLFPDFNHPCISDAKVITGGILPAGSVSLSITYLDRDLNPTNWITSSGNINIFKDALTAPYHSINGSFTGQTTNKAIEITLDNLDDRFFYYRVAAIMATKGTGDVDTVYYSPPIQIGVDTYRIDGNWEGWSEGSVEDLRLGKIKIDVAGHIEQLENRMILAEIRDKQVNYCKFQRYASRICPKYVVKEVPIEQLEKGDAKNPVTPFDTVSFPRDEIIPAGIVYVWADGEESPAFHIPGTPKDVEACTYNGPGYERSYCAVIEWACNDCRDCLGAYVEYTLAVGPDRTLVTGTVQGVAGDVKTVYCGEPDEEIEIIDISPLYSGDCLQMEVFGRVEGSVNPTSGGNCEYTGVDSEVMDTWKPWYAAFTDEEVIYNGQLTHYNDLPDSEKLEKWQVDNTANPDSGRLAYWECSSAIYPTRTSCDFDEDYWGEDVCGNPLTGQPIRHIKMPSVQQEPVKIGDNIRLLGLEFDNIQYPHPDIVGHYFVFGERDETNRTVIENGVMGAMNECADGIVGYWAPVDFFNTRKPVNSYHYAITPNTLYNNEISAADYVRINGYHEGTLPARNNPGNDAFKLVAEYENDIFHVEQWLQYGDLVVDERNTFIADEEFYLPPLNNVYDSFGNEVVNLSMSNPLRTMRAELPKDRPKGYTLKNITLKANRDVHCNLDAIVYRKGHNCMKTQLGDQTVYGGDVYITNLKVWDSKFFKIQKGWIDEVIAIVAIIVAVVLSYFTGGVSLGIIGYAAAIVGISLYALSAVIQNLIDGRYDCIVQAPDADVTLKEDFTFLEDYDGYMAYLTHYLSGIYIESEINLDLRSFDLSEQCQYPPYEHGGIITDFFKPKLLYIDENGETKSRVVVCPELYRHNDDYLIRRDPQVYFPLPETYDCCSNCLEYHPNRVHWSQQSFQEERADNYRVFLPNNYKDIEANKGRITDLLRKNENLYVFTTGGLWQVPKNIQERTTDEIVSFIGTGDFFALPARVMIDDEIGSGGTENKWSVVKTRYGAFWVSEAENRVYLLANQVEELSLQGNRNWFENNLTQTLNTKFEEVTGKPYPLRNNPANPFGIGVHATYDPRHKRIIITKIDYDFNVEFHGILPDNPNPNRLYWDEAQKGFVTPLQLQPGQTIIGRPIQLTNPDFFINKSWTISYSLINKAWEGWHSYIPHFYMHDDNTFYSYIDNTAWKHNFGPAQTFYGKYYPHILETVVTDQIETNVLSHITLQSEAVKSNVDQRYTTFNKLWLYNSRQSSGLVELTPTKPVEDYFSAVVGNVGANVQISRQERDWQINNFYDYVVDYSLPIYTKEWNALKDSYFIDKLPTNTSFSKDWQTLERFRDKWTAFRFIFDSGEDVTLTTNYVIDNKLKSPR